MTDNASADAAMAVSAGEPLRAPANASRNHKKGDYARAEHQWYVEPRWCVEQLADAIDFDGSTIWDPCCGGGTIPRVFHDRGLYTAGTDIADRGYPDFMGVHDVLSDPTSLLFLLNGGRGVSAVLNPPFSEAEAIVRRLLAAPLRRVAIIQQLSFLASRGRHPLFTEFPPSDILVCSRRPSMPPGAQIEALGDRAFKGGTTDFCWIVWTRPHDRETRVCWLAPGGDA